LALALLVAGCTDLVRTGDTVTESQTVEAGAAEEALVQVTLGAGILTLSGGADALMDATFRYNVSEWKPQVDYSVDGSRGTLVVTHDDAPNPIGTTFVNEWTIALNSDMPIELEAEAGASQAELNLRDMALQSLRYDVGAGDTTVDLSSGYDNDVRATITGGIGALKVLLPADMGVRISVSTGLGDVTTSGLTRDGDDYVNEAYGSAPYTLTLDVEAGVGAIELTVAE